jgi:hypothetical protein
MTQRCRPTLGRSRFPARTGCSVNAPPRVGRGPERVLPSARALGIWASAAGVGLRFVRRTGAAAARLSEHSTGRGRREPRSHESVRRRAWSLISLSSNPSPTLIGAPSPGSKERRSAKRERTPTPKSSSTASRHRHRHRVKAGRPEWRARWGWPGARRALTRAWRALMRAVQALMRAVPALLAFRGDPTSASSTIGLPSGSTICSSSATPTAASGSESRRASSRALAATLPSPSTTAGKRNNHVRLQRVDGSPAVLSPARSLVDAEVVTLPRLVVAPIDG